MKNQAIKLCSVVLALTIMMSMIALLPSNATEVINSVVTTDESGNATGDLTFEEGLSDSAIIIKSTSDYKKYAEQNQIAGKNNLIKSAAALPTSVDNSDSKYFPEIDSQGGLGACVAWAQAYYQFTYTMNKSRNVETTAENTFSPKWVYNYVNSGYDGGSISEEAYDFMQCQGNAPLALVPYDDNYLSWSPEEEIWKTAIKYRVKDYQYFEDLGIEETQITSADDSDLEAVKTALANGEVLTYGTYISSWQSTTIKTNSAVPENSKYAGQNVVTAQIGSQGPHRMTLVGYNDNIWTDINGNNTVDDGEMGAFKIANSWGTDYANDGFNWVAYDALNKTSCVEGGAESVSRQAIFSLIARIDVKPYNSEPDVYLTCTLNSSERTHTEIVINAEKDGTQYSSYALTKRRYSSGVKGYSYDGTNTSSDGTMVFALDNAVPEVTADNFTDYSWSITFTDKEADGKILTVKDAKIVNEKTNQTYKPEISYPFTLDGEDKSLEFAQSALNNVVVYYTGYDNPTLHYKISNGSWQSASMTENIERRGYVYKHVIEMADINDVTLYFSDENGNVDNNNGQYFKASNGLNYYVTENVRVPVSVEFATDTSDIPDVYKYSVYKAVASGGYEPYIYEFVITNNDTGEVKTYEYSDESEFQHRFAQEGTYTVTVNVTDQANKTASSSMEVVVENHPFEFSQFSTTPSEKLFVGNNIDFTAVTDFENVISRGNVHSMYEFTIKNSDGDVCYTTSKRSDKYHLMYRTSTIYLSWIPPKADTYSVTVSSTDGSDEYAEKTVCFDVKDKLIGDSNGDGTISIRDATMIQKYIVDSADITEIFVEMSDCNDDDLANIKDATLIQMYLASYENTARVGNVIEYISVPTEPETTVPVTTQPATVAPTTVAEANKVTFTNSFNWSGTIYCYYWSSSNTTMTSWPGKAMTNAGTNEFGEVMYTFEVPDGATYIIFSNSSSQTTDIPYSGGEVRYYPLSTTDSNGHNKVATW